MEIVRLRLQELIDEKGTSQSALSRDSGVSFTTISRMCRNVTGQVSLETLGRLARALGEGVEPATSSSSRRKRAGRSELGKATSSSAARSASAAGTSRRARASARRRATAPQGAACVSSPHESQPQFPHALLHFCRAGESTFGVERASGRLENDAFRGKLREFFEPIEVGAMPLEPAAGCALGRLPTG